MLPKATLRQVWFTRLAYDIAEYRGCALIRHKNRATISRDQLEMLEMLLVSGRPHTAVGRPQDRLQQGDRLQSLWGVRDRLVWVAF